jgi:hypothetical protein
MALRHNYFTWFKNETIVFHEHDLYKFYHDFKLALVIEWHFYSEFIMLIALWVKFTPAGKGFHFPTISGWPFFLPNPVQFGLLY